MQGSLLPSPRAVFALGFLGCLAAMGGALYLLVDDAVDGQLLRLAPVDGEAPSAAAAVAKPPARQ